MRMLIASGSYQNYHNRSVSNQLTNVGKVVGRVWQGKRWICWCMTKEVHCTLSNNVVSIQKWKVQIRHNQYFSLIFSVFFCLFSRKWMCIRSTAWERRRSCPAPYSPCCPPATPLCISWPGVGTPQSSTVFYRAVTLREAWYTIEKSQRWHTNAYSCKLYASNSVKRYFLYIFCV